MALQAHLQNVGTQTYCFCQNTDTYQQTNNKKHRSAGEVWYNFAYVLISDCISSL